LAHEQNFGFARKRQAQSAENFRAWHGGFSMWAACAPAPARLQTDEEMASKSRGIERLDEKLLNGCAAMAGLSN
jgi:hypothetical protein